MDVLRVLSITMARISTFRCYQIMLLLAAAMAVVAFYYFGSEKQNFSSTTKRIKETQASHNTNRDDADLSVDVRSGHAESRMGTRDDLKEKPLRNKSFHVLMMFTKVNKSLTLQNKFQVSMRSMAKHGRFLEDEVLVLHFVSDVGSQELGKRMIHQLLIDATFQYEVVFHNVDALTEKLFPIVEAMQKHFSAGSGAYYSDAIFFLSVAMHRIMPAELKRIVQLDLDLKFRSNIRDLFQEFNRFPPEAVIGIAREMQPVYRHTFWQYRKENPKSRVGDPPPDGLPGFNSGVMLLNLDVMRRSTLYNQLLEPERVAHLAEKFHFRGHLGDQDFFTMIVHKHPHEVYKDPPALLASALTPQERTRPTTTSSALTGISRYLTRLSLEELETSFTLHQSSNTFITREPENASLSLMSWCFGFLTSSEQRCYRYRCFSSPGKDAFKH